MAWVYVVLIVAFLVGLLYIAKPSNNIEDDDETTKDDFVNEFRKNLDNWYFAKYFNILILQGFCNVFLIELWLTLY